MKRAISFIHNIQTKLSNKWWSLTTMKYYKTSFQECGANFRLAKGAIIEGASNIKVGDNVYIGPGAVIYSTDAQLKMMSGAVPMSLF